MRASKILEKLDGVVMAGVAARRTLISEPRRLVKALEEVKSATEEAEAVIVAYYRESRKRKSRTAA